MASSDHQDIIVIGGGPGDRTLAHRLGTIGHIFRAMVAHIVEGYVVGPSVQKRTVHLPPALTVLAIVMLATIFGIWGVLIATPLTAVLLVGITRVYVEDVLGDPAGPQLAVRSHWYWFTPPDITSADVTPGSETGQHARSG